MKKKGTRAGKTKGTRAGKKSGTRAEGEGGTRGLGPAKNAGGPQQQELGARASGPQRNDPTQEAGHDVGARASGPQLKNEALADRDDDGWIIRAPRVGIFRRAVETELPAQSGDVVGTLGVLSRRIPLVLPAEVDGLIAESMLADRTQAVEFGQPLFKVRAGTKGPAARDARSASTAAESHGAAAIPEGCFPVVSPIDGVFYSRPSPGAPPFVEAGAAIETGRTIGLVEAMKSFNAISYGGPGLPPRATIVETRAKDAAEVRQGTILLVVRPAR